MAGEESELRRNHREIKHRDETSWDPGRQQVPSAGRVGESFSEKPLLSSRRIRNHLCQDQAEKTANAKILG